MPYRMIDFSKAEKENVQVLMRNLNELAELGEEWVFRDTEMPPGATPDKADVVFFKHHDRYCITTRPKVTYRGDNPSCKRLFARGCETFGSGGEIYEFFRFLSHPPAELPERQAEMIVDLDRVQAAGFCLKDGELLAAAIRKVAFEYGLVVDRIDADIIVGLLGAAGKTRTIERVSTLVNRIFCPFFFQNKWTYPGDYPLRLAGTSLFDLRLFPFGKVLPLRYEESELKNNI